MILSTREQAILEREIQKKYGEEVLKDPRDAIDSGRKHEIAQELTREEERWEDKSREANIETLEDGSVIENGRGESAREDRACSCCGRERFLFTSMDEYYIVRNNVCEKCFYLHIQ